MYQRQLSFARQGRDRSLEAAAYGALGLGHRLLRCYDKALGYHTQAGLQIAVQAAGKYFKLYQLYVVVHVTKLLTLKLKSSWYPHNKRLYGEMLLICL